MNPPPVRNLAWLARHHFGTVRWVSALAFLGPAAWLGLQWTTQALGVNPLNRLLHFSGRWALIMLAVTLAVTPARRLSVWFSQTVHARYGKRVSDWNWLIRLRRQFGLITFFYAGLHLSIYIAFDVGFDWPVVRDDVLDRPFVMLGFAAFALLVPLAATSNQASIRWLGRGWRRLHMLSYPIALLALAHFWIAAKVGDLRPLPYTVVLGALLAVRVRAWLRGDRTPAAEVKERS